MSGDGRAGEAEMVHQNGSFGEGIIVRQQSVIKIAKLLAGNFNLEVKTSAGRRRSVEGALHIDAHRWPSCPGDVN